VCSCGVPLDWCLLAHFCPASLPAVCCRWAPDAGSRPCHRLLRWDQAGQNHNGRNTDGTGSKRQPATCLSTRGPRMFRPLTDHYPSVFTGPVGIWPPRGPCKNSPPFATKGFSVFVFRLCVFCFCCFFCFVFVCVFFVFAFLLFLLAFVDVTLKVMWFCVFSCVVFFFFFVFLCGVCGSLSCFVFVFEFFFFVFFCVISCGFCCFFLYQNLLYSFVSVVDSCGFCSSVFLFVSVLFDVSCFPFFRLFEAARRLPLEASAAPGGRRPSDHMPLNTAAQHVRACVCLCSGCGAKSTKKHNKDKNTAKKNKNKDRRKQTQKKTPNIHQTYTDTFSTFSKKSPHKKSNNNTKQTQIKHKTHAEQNKMKNSRKNRKTTEELHPQ